MGAKNRRRGGLVGRAIRYLATLVTAVVIIAMVAAALFVVLRSPGKAQPFKDEYGNVLADSVSEVVYTEIGGIQQGMILKGRNTAKNPVLLFLHGGPGSPEFMMASPSKLRLEEVFTVCWWDQRGSGLSFDTSIDPETMTLERFVEDTVEVVEYLRARFGVEKVYLMGHSWGSMLGVYTVARHPELFHAYIGVGQVADQFRSEMLAYEYMVETATARGDEKLLAKLRQYAIERPEDLTDAYMQVRSEGMNKYGVGSSRRYKSMWDAYIMPMVVCREYTLMQKLNYMRGMAESSAIMMPLVLEDSLFESVPSLDVPVYIVQGLYDYQVSYTVAKEYYEALDAPAKQFYTFEDSAHSPLFEEPSRFMQIMREDVLGKS